MARSSESIAALRAPRSPATIAALHASAARASAWAKEAHALRVLRLDHPWAGDTFGLSYCKTAAQNIFRLFIRVRFHKIHRARLRRYQRLRYLYELEHPPFATAEFPEHPSMELWRAPFDLSSCGWACQTTAKEPPFLTEDDDQISPVLFTSSLPHV
ncbi:hypothetical protein C8R47DRAFT_1230443 [Mycena vitilis]|nr:hypothetical protein C8R47DRAFT_1230443 [Mycena vitilis]